MEENTVSIPTMPMSRGSSSLPRKIPKIRFMIWMAPLLSAPQISPFVVFSFKLCSAIDSCCCLQHAKIRLFYLILLFSDLFRIHHLDNSCRTSCDNCVSGHIFCNDTVGCDDSSITDGDIRENRCFVTNPDIITYDDWTIGYDGASGGTDK